MSVRGDSLPVISRVRGDRDFRRVGLRRCIDIPLITKSIGVGGVRSDSSRKFLGFLDWSPVGERGKKHSMRSANYFSRDWWAMA